MCLRNAEITGATNDDSVIIIQRVYCLVGRKLLYRMQLVEISSGLCDAFNRLPFFMSQCRLMAELYQQKTG